MKEHVKREIKEWVKSLAVAFVLAMAVRTFIIQPFVIPTGSMQPTLNGVIKECRICEGQFNIYAKECPRHGRTLRLIQRGDRIFVNKFIYGAKIPFVNFRFPALKEPKAGDIIVFKYPINPKRDFIKRLIARGGETVEIKDGNIFIDGRLLNIPGEVDYVNRGEYGKEGEKITVPTRHFYVLGDNSGNSKDSRYWGFVPEKYLVGRAFIIFWPPWRVRILE